MGPQCHYSKNKFRSKSGRPRSVGKTFLICIYFSSANYKIELKKPTSFFFLWVKDLVDFKSNPIQIRSLTDTHLTCHQITQVKRNVKFARRIIIRRRRRTSRVFRKVLLGISDDCIICFFFLIIKNS